MRPRYTVALLAAVIAASVLSVASQTALAEGSSQPAVTVILDRLPVVFPVTPFIENGTTMVPLRALSEALGFKVQWDGHTETITCARDDTVIRLALGERSADVSGTTFQLETAPYRVGDHTVVPLRFFSECLGYTVSWDGESRTAYVESPKNPMEVWGFYALGSKEYSSWNDAFNKPYPFVSREDCPAKSMAGMFLGWFGVDAGGHLVETGHPSGFTKPDGWPAVLMQLKLAETRAVAMVFAENVSGTLSELLADEIRREALAREIYKASWEYGGILIDFEGLGLKEDTARADAENFNLFLDALKAKDQDKFLAVAVPPVNSHFQGYDHAHVGEVADRVVLMAYGYEDPNTPSPTAPFWKVDEAIRLETSLVPPGKILLGIASYGTTYVQEKAGWALLARPPAKDPFSQANLSNFQPEAACHKSSWEEASTEYVEFQETAESLVARVLLAKRHALGGVALWRLGILPDGWWRALTEAVDPVR